MMKHSFQSHNLRSEGESEESSSCEEEEEEKQEELNRKKMMLRKEKVRAELEAEIARDIWNQQTIVGAKQDCDKWKGFGVNPSGLEKGISKADKDDEKTLRDQQMCLSLVAVVLVVCLILYGVLLHFVVKASRC